MNKSLAARDSKEKMERICGIAIQLCESCWQKKKGAERRQDLQTGYTRGQQRDSWWHLPSFYCLAAFVSWKVKHTLTATLTVSAGLLQQFNIGAIPTFPSHSHNETRKKEQSREGTKPNSMKTTVFRDDAPCSLAEINWRFRCTCLLPPASGGWDLMRPPWWWRQ